MTNSSKPQFTLISAFCEIIEDRDKTLFKEPAAIVNQAVAYLTARTSFTINQCALVAAILADTSGLGVVKGEICHHLGISNLRFISMSDDLESLIDMGWVTEHYSHPLSTYSINKSVVNALQHNIVPVNIEKETDDDSDSQNEDTSQHRFSLSDVLDHQEDAGLQGKDPEFIKSYDIQERELFYNKQDEEQIRQLIRVLRPDNFSAVQQRLGQKGMRKGICCLLCGAPGVGKTEFVYQICRQTGRSIYNVDASKIRSRWIGEQEKNVRNIFRKYRMMCYDADNIPVMLFNEADSVFSKRTDKPDDLGEKEENTTLNMILEEMEKLDGVMIATSNLLNITMDPAMERRFLFKVNLSTPDADTRLKIWHYMCSELPEHIIRPLSEKYQLSGGQIENVVRRTIIDYAIRGAYPDLDTLYSYCDHEKFLDTKAAHTIKTVHGFSNK